VNLGRETATRAAKRLIMLPPFAPAAETWARTTVESALSARGGLQLLVGDPGRQITANFKVPAAIAH
jgi:hypothetical protein